MRNQLDVNGEGFELEGQWSTDGADRCFDGTVRRISSGDSMPVTCRIPLSAIRAHGERYHEEQCQISLKEDIATDFFCPLCDGAMISSSGFTPAGNNYAKARGIDTFRLIDTESIDWKSYVSIPALVRSTNFKGFRVIFENFTILPMAIENSDIRALRYRHKIT